LPVPRASKLVFSKRSSERVTSTLLFLPLPSGRLSSARLTLTVNELFTIIAHLNLVVISKSAFSNGRIIDILRLLAFANSVPLRSES